MTIVSRPWQRLSPAGRVLLPLAAVAGGLAWSSWAASSSGILPNLWSWIYEALNDNVLLLRFVVAATAVLLFTVPTAFVIIYLEMKVIALLNLRLGPNRLGPWGVAGVDAARLQGAGQGGLHPDRRGRAGLHPRAGRRLPRLGHELPGHPVRARPVRPGHEHRPCSTSSPWAAWAWSA